jgi:hypothetical protein
LRVERESREDFSEKEMQLMAEIEEKVRVLREKNVDKETELTTIREELESKLIELEELQGVLAANEKAKDSMTAKHSKDIACLEGGNVDKEMELTTIREVYGIYFIQSYTNSDPNPSPNPNPNSNSQSHYLSLLRN